MPPAGWDKLPPRALITGGMGFIGSHLADVLLERGHRVTLIDDLSTGRFSNVEHLVGHPRARLVTENITNAVVLDRVASEADVIFHLAAAVGVKLVVENPAHTIEDNVMGTEAVLRAGLRYRAKVLIASTSEVYGKGSRCPFAEEDDVVLGPTSHSRWGYAASKMVDEFLGLAYYRQKGLPVVVFRLFNTVGPRQTGHYGMVIPRLVQQALRGEALTVYGDGQQSRCFAHVLDTVDAISRLADCPEAVGRVFNVGSTEEVTILELAHRVLFTVDLMRGRPRPADPEREREAHLREGRITFIPYSTAYAEGFEDMRRRVPDISKIHRFVGWQPTRSLDEILRDVVASLLLRN